MPSAFNILTNLAPAAMSIAGAALLMTAAPLALALPFHNYPAAAIADIVLWITLATVLSFCAVRLMPRRAAPRCTLALAVFALFLLPQTEWDHMPAATQMLSLAGAALLLAGLPLCAPLKPVLAALDRLLSANRFLPSWLLIGIFYVTFLSAAVALSWHCFHFYPIYTDTEGQYIHAKYIAMGHLYWPAPPPPLSRFFYLPMSVDDHGKWYSQYQPLHVLLLALGHDLSAPWMVNPTEGALTLVATYMLARRITDEQTARLSALLMLGCQLILFMSSEYMNHASALLFATLFLWGYAETLHAQAEDRMNDACRAGFVTG
ncbi:MAG: hypothetical protein KGJ21_10250, partial [Pseudomonadota bacterium]|nr:hypothetical protein [Pseudomonadota bacterium]